MHRVLVHLFCISAQPNISIDRLQGLCISFVQNLLVFGILLNRLIEFIIRMIRLSKIPNRLNWSLLLLMVVYLVIGRQMVLAFQIIFYCFGFIMLRLQITVAYY